MKRLEDLVSHLPAWVREEGLLNQATLVALVFLAGFLGAIVARLIVASATRRAAGWLSSWGQVPDQASSERMGKAAGTIVYWGVLLLALMTALEVAGLAVVSQWLGGAATYIPRVVSAILLLGFGVLGARIAGHLLDRASRSVNVPAMRRFRTVLEACIIFTSFIVAVEQLGIEISFLKSLVLIVVACVFGGAALAFGLGSREAIADILSIHYLRRQFQEGQTIRFKDVEGTILHIGETYIVVETSAGHVRIPARQLAHEASLLVIKGGST